MSLAKFLARAGIKTAKLEGIDPKEKVEELLEDKPKKKPKRKETTSEFMERIGH